MKYRFKTKTRVKRIEEKIVAVRTWKEGDEVKAETESRGWFVTFEGSWESLHLGYDKPDIQVGQPVTIILEVG